jgi:hypothetical protein
MESLLVSSLVGTGVALSKNGKNNRKDNKSKSIFKDPSQNSIYSSNYTKNTNNIEQKLAKKHFRESKNTLDTNVVPRQFNNKIINRNNTSIKYLQKTNKESQETYTSLLSGQVINKETFKQKNAPFFGSHIRQNQLNSNSNIVDNHTGTEHFNRTKSTPTPMFEPTKDINYRDNTVKNDEISNRHVPSRFKKNELPFEQVKVGPGMDDELTTPSGGFHQDTRDFVMPKTIDDLRPASNPQISYKGRVIPGKSANGKAAAMPHIAKNRPDTYYINNSDRYFTSTAGVNKQTARSCHIVKDTNRKDSANYTGSAGPAQIIKNPKRALYKKSTKLQAPETGPRNLFKNGAKTGEHTKNTYHLTSNERDITQKRTHTSNITTAVKSLFAPILDVLKTTKKENVQGNLRQAGNFGNSGVAKNVVWDPNDIAKKTIKETNIHDNRTGNVNTNGKGVAWDEDDIAKTTIRETTTDNDHTGNMNTNGKGVAWDEDDIAKTTIRETTTDNDHTGHLNTTEKGVAWDSNDIAKRTIKETNIHDNRTGNMIIHDKGTVIDYKTMKFRTTIRETTGEEDQNLNMKVISKSVVKDPNDRARTTIKETNIHDNRTGNVKGPIKLAVYDPNDVAKKTIKETRIDNKHTGNVSGITHGNGYMTNEHEAPNTNRQFTSDFEYEGIADRERNGGLGYITNEQEAPNTNRQFTSDFEYEGGANSMYKKSISKSSYKNMRTNDCREGSLKGRNPTPQGVKLYNGSDKIEVEVKKIEGDIINTRELTGNKVINSISEIKPCSMTQEKNLYDYEILDERIEPDLLKAFNNNPYTQSLSSYAYN